MMVMKSLLSRDMVKMKFNWQWFYYFLTDDGIEHLREVLHLPSTVSPLTMTKQTKTLRGPADDEERKGKGKGKGKKGKGKKGGWSSRGYEGDEGAEKPAEE